MPEALTGCGSCVACVSRTGYPCTLGTRPPATRTTPPLGRVLGGRDVGVTEAPTNFYGRRLEEYSVDWLREADVEIGFEPCRRATCEEIALHPASACLRRNRQQIDEAA